MSAARVLTVRQPWASLTALGVKRIEVRTRPTNYRGTVLVHAAAVDTNRFMHRPENAPAWDRLGDFIGGDAPIRGAVVAMAELVDCLPIFHVIQLIGTTGAPFPNIQVNGPGTATIARRDAASEDISGQIPYCGGLLVPGNYAYLWADVRPLREPIPHKGGLGLRHASDELYAAAMERAA